MFGERSFAEDMIESEQKFTCNPSAYPQQVPTTLSFDPAFSGGGNTILQQNRSNEELPSSSFITAIGQQTQSQDQELQGQSEAVYVHDGLLLSIHDNKPTSQHSVRMNTTQERELANHSQF